MLPFTAHNLVLADGTHSIPGEMLLEERPMARAVMQTLNSFFPDRAAGELSIVDLGCLEGGYTALFARAGFSALGIEGRPDNIARCQFGAGQLGLPGLRFACDDVHSLPEYGPFDVTFCSGLLYHLDDPVAFLETLSAQTRRLLILETHFAGETRPARFPHLSDMTEHEGVPGRWYPEHEDEDSEEDMGTRLWASIGNRKSFWIEKRHLLRKLVALGFSPVYEQFDFLRDVVEDDFIEQYGASLFVAVRRPAA